MEIEYANEPKKKDIKELQILKIAISYSNLKLHLQKLIFYDLFVNQHVIYSTLPSPLMPILPHANKECSTQQTNQVKVHTIFNSIALNY